MDRWAPLKVVSAPVRMIVRTMERRPLRTLSSIAGLAMAAMILVVGQYSFDALDELIDVYFSRAQTDDATIVFTNPRSDRALSELRRMPGVTRVEGFRAVPMRIRFGPVSRRTVLNGLEQGAQLRRLIGADGNEQQLSLRGVVLTAKLAEILGARSGDVVTIEVLEGTRPVREMRVAATTDELIGTAAYLPLAEVNRLMSEGPSVSGANVAVDANRTADLYTVLKRTPAVATVFLRAAMVKSFRETIRKNIAMSAGLIVAFACIIACGVIYNAARVALSERGRELASLRVLGFSHAEVALMLIGEQIVLTIAAIPIGFAAGRALSARIAAAFESEAYRLPVVISGKTYAISFLIVAVAAAFTAAVVQRRIRTLDLVEVLKARE
jgi:putative ABC transport system permease protein